MDQIDIEIAEDGDWNKLIEQGIDVILDPMILRSAELFFRGKPSDDNLTVWDDGISRNIDSLEAFIDALVLADALPMIDYGYTYDSQIGYDAGNLYDRVNAGLRHDEKIMRNVHVFNSASEEGRAAAVDNLMALNIEAKDEWKQQVVEEFAAYDHWWRPDLNFLGELDEADLQVAKFRYGLHLFDYFSSRAGVAHCIQTKRSRFYLADALGGKNPSYEYDESLRTELQTVVNSVDTRIGKTISMNACPSFLACLLEREPNSPRELLENALALREDKDIQLYKKWRREMIKRWRAKKYALIRRRNRTQRGGKKCAARNASYR